jgi:hypothetical protein
MSLEFRAEIWTEEINLELLAKREKLKMYDINKGQDINRKEV